MAGFIVLEDGRAYASKGWAFRATLEAIVQAIPETDEGKLLADWLRNDPTVQVYNNVDVKELSPTSRQIFLDAAKSAYHTQSSKGQECWADPQSWDGWIQRFGDLVKMIECVRGGDSTQEFNPHMQDVIPPTSEKRGPGW